MAYSPPVFSLLKDNVLKSGNPLGLPAGTFTEWAEGLDLPREGTTFLYTGLEYQLLTYLSGLQSSIKMMGAFGENLSLARGVMGLLDNVGIDYMSVFKQSDAKEWCSRILQTFVKVLRKAGIDFAYMFEDEPYAGSLLYEMGYQTEVAEYGRKIKELFARKNVKELIVLSPHSLEMFRKIFPSLGVNFEFKAVHYTEALAGKFQGGKLPQTGEYSIHDPCHLSRSLGIMDEPRTVLKTVEGLSIREVCPSNRLYTTCCGAPIETYLPELAESLGEQRIEEFKRDGLDKVIVMCPFCLFNLQKAAQRTKSGVEIMDMSEILGKSLEG